MARNYEWSAALTVVSGGYVGELISIEQNGTVLFSGAVDNPPQTIDTGWRRTSTTSGDETFTYTYRDSDRKDNNNCTKVSVTMRDQWSVSFNNRNYMTVTVTSTLISAVRTLIGSISNVDRHIWMSREAGGHNYLNIVDPASTSHTIASNISLGSFSFTLAPGENATRATIYWRNTNAGHESDPIPNIYTDILNLGIHFRNILPRDHRVGASLDTNTGVWKSHNRVNGACHLVTNTQTMALHEMRNVGDGTNKGDPPLILKGSSGSDWYDQRNIGKE